MTAHQRVVIRRLVLDGVPRHERDRVAAAFEAELARLLHEHPFRPGHRVDAPDAPRPGDGSAEDVGRRAAAAVHARLLAGGVR